jgi:hypothetical protein
MTKKAYIVVSRRDLLILLERTSHCPLEKTLVIVDIKLFDKRDVYQISSVDFVLNAYKAA